MTAWRRAAGSLWGLLPLWGLLGSGPLLAQNGYDVRGGQVVVDRARHWEAWTMPTHLVRLERDGTVRSREFRTVYELLSDQSFGRPVVLTRDAPRIANMDSTVRRDFRGDPVRDLTDNLVYDHVVRPGASRAGSNPHLMHYLVDGDPTTFWEPDLDDPPEDWWVEVGLGRPVPLERLRLSFAEEGLGDPFYRFLILLGPAQGSYVDDMPRNTDVFIPFDGVNTDRRTFVFDAERVSEYLPADPWTDPERRLPIHDSYKGSSTYLGVGEPSPDWDGKLVEMIRIVVTDTRGGRAEEIGEDEWQALPAAERGDIVHFLRDGDFEEPVSEETWLSLPEDRRGGRVHYRRELPRLAEVEGWGQGDDLGIEFLSGGGSVVETSTSGQPGFMFDGSYGSHNHVSTYIVSEPGRNTITIDLGGTVWLKEVRTVGFNPPRGYRLRSSIGARDAQGNLQWDQFSSAEREANLHNGHFRLLADLLEPSRRVRFLELIAFALPDDAGELTSRYWPRIRLIWLFAEGPAAEAVIESDLIELPGEVTLGAVRWEADEPPGAEVQIRTRTGDQLLERIRYFDTDGNEKTASQYKRLSFTRKGPVDTSYVAGPGWSSWSRKYERPGDPATSPGLRRFMRIQARLVNHDRASVPAIRRISVDLKTPVAQRLGAEVWPDLAAAGRPDTFEVFLQPGFLEGASGSQSPGFDELLLRADPPIDLRLIDLAAGTEEELSRNEPDLLFDRPHADGLQDAEGRLLRVLGQRDSLWLRLPEPVRSAPEELLPRTFYRRLAPGDEVPAGLDGHLLTQNGYNELPEDEQGAIRWFRRDGEELEEVDAAAWEELPEEERGPVRFYRVVTSLGEQTVYTALGDSLSDRQYGRLRAADRGRVIGPGRLLRVRFASAVYLPSTLLDLAVRNSGLDTPWQGAAGEDVTGLRPANSLAIRADEIGRIVDDLAIAPNPFTPNGDGINDEAEIRFSLLSMAAARPVQVRIYSLGGRLVRRLELDLLGGPQTVVWDGREDGGALAPPGLYLCQVGALADSEAGRRKRSRVIALAY